MTVNKKVFTVEVNGQTVELAAVRPSPKIQAEAQKIYNSTWASLVSGTSPAIVRQRVPKILEQQGLWTDSEQKEYEQLEQDLAAVARKLAVGKNGYPTRDEAIEAAKNSRTKRVRLFELNAQRSSLDEFTAEAQSEVARLNYLIYACTVYNNNRTPFYKSLEDFYERADESATLFATNNLMLLLNSGVDLDFEKKFPENKFLIDQGVLNDKLQYLKDGRPYDPDTGYYINEDGRFVNENNEFINRNGELINEDGSLRVEFVPYE